MNTVIPDISYIQEYNIKEDIISNKKISLNIDDICWNFDISYGRELLPSDNIEDSTKYQRSIYFKLELKQLGGINFDKQNY